MAWLSENKYNLAGNIDTGLTLNNANPNAGTPIAGTPLYGSGLYGSQLYQYAACYGGVYESDYYDNKLTISATGDNGDITYNFRLSNDNVNWSSWDFGIPQNIVGTTTLYMRAKYFEIRIYFHSSLWSDSDSLAISSIISAFITFAPDTVIYANEMNGNFQHVGQGNWLPKGGTSLEYTNGSYSLGHPSYKWNNVYIKNFIPSSEIQKCFYMAGEIILSAPASSVEITGLNGENDKIYNIRAFIVNTQCGSTIYMHANGASSASYQIYQEYHYGAAYGGISSIGNSTGIPVLWNISDTTTTQYVFNNIWVYCPNEYGAGKYYTFESQMIEYTGNFASSLNEQSVRADASAINTLTSLKIVAPTVNSLLPGTRLEVWTMR